MNYHYCRFSNKQHTALHSLTKYRRKQLLSFRGKLVRNQHNNTDTMHHKWKRPIFALAWRNTKYELGVHVPDVLSLRHYWRANMLTKRAIDILWEYPSYVLHRRYYTEYTMMEQWIGTNSTFPFCRTIAAMRTRITKVSHKVPTLAFVLKW